MTGHTDVKYPRQRTYNGLSWIQCYIACTLQGRPSVTSLALLLKWQPCIRAMVQLFPGFRAMPCRLQPLLWVLNPICHLCNAREGPWCMFQPCKLAHQCSACRVLYPWFSLSMSKWWCTIHMVKVGSAIFTCSPFFLEWSGACPLFLISSFLLYTVKV